MIRVRSQASAAIDCMRESHIGGAAASVFCAASVFVTVSDVVCGGCLLRRGACISHKRGVQFQRPPILVLPTKRPAAKSTYLETAETPRPFLRLPLLFLPVVPVGLPVHTIASFAVSAGTTFSVVDLTSAASTGKAGFACDATTSSGAVVSGSVVVLCRIAVTCSVADLGRTVVMSAAAELERRSGHVLQRHRRWRH